MPPHVSSLRLLFPSSVPLISPLKPSSLPFSLFPKPKPKPKPLSFFTVLASSSSRRRSRPFHQRPRSPGRRNASTFTERKTREGSVMEETESARFNKRRAEGGDKADKPKRQLHRKERKLNPSNTISYVQILGTGMDTQDTSPSVLLFFDKQRFIFNAGEGLQRFCTEHKIKLSKIDHIFLSRVCSETAGGLPGLLLTLAGMGEEGMSVNVWGPSDLKYLVDAMKSFIPNAAMVHTRSFGPSLSAVGTCMDDPSTNPIVLVDNEAVKISAIILQPSFSEGSGLTNASENVLEERMDSEPSTPKRKMTSVRKPGDMSVVYVCELPEIPGKFHPEKALAFGLKPGRKYGELQDGKSVMSDRQNIMVHPSDVMDPSTPGPVVILVDCPTESHLQELLAIQCLSNYYADFSGPPENAKVVTCIIHLSPASVVSSPSYQKWMRRFGSAQNIMAGHERENVEIPILKSSARVAARLNYLCPQFFPAPGFWSVKQLGCSAQDNIVSSEVSDLKPCEVISAKNLLKFTLRPLAQLGVDRSGIPISMAPSEIIDELLSEIPDVSDAAQNISQLWHLSTGTKGEISCIQDDRLMVEEPWLNENKLPSCLEDIRRDDMEIVLLGTGSSQPSKYRNVSSIHIHLFSKGGLLFDCGEGTLGQLKRRYGVDGADEVVRGLRCIWISHIHADHHTGLARILALRRDLLKDVPHEPLLVIGPRQLKRYLDAYQRLEDIDMQFLDCKFTTEAALEAGDLSNFDDNSNRKTNGQSTQKIDSTIFAKGSRMQSYFNRPGSPVDIGAAIPILKSLKEMLSEAGLDALISFPVVHCPQAFGVVLKAGKRINSAGKVIPGWKIVYSGDTRPCLELKEASRGATVLIHEATFEDGLVDEAIARNHSTTQEAIDVGNSAQAYRIVLTHFSQRYPKIPVFGETHGHNTSIAFDLMSINLADLPVLPKVIPYLKLLFPTPPEEEAEEELGNVVSTV